MAPNIIKAPKSHTAKLSGSVMFNCVANAKPRTVIQWIKNGNILRNNYIRTPTKIKITNSTKGVCALEDPPDQCETSSTLEIFYAESADSGEYICNASNDEGYQEKSAKLSIDDDGMCVNLYPYNIAIQFVFTFHIKYL